MARHISQKTDFAARQKRDSRYDEGCPALAQSPQGSLDFVLGFGVDGTRCLVKQHNRRSLEYGARNRYTLQLSAGKFDSALANSSLVACK